MGARIQFSSQRSLMCVLIILTWLWTEIYEQVLCGYMLRIIEMYDLIMSVYDLIDWSGQIINDNCTLRHSLEIHEICIRKIWVYELAVLRTRVY